MELNPDCIRDILLDVECVVTPKTRYCFPSQSQKLLEKYSKDEVFYHILQCSYNGFFIGFQRYSRESCYIGDLSPKAHEFIANIRQDTNWNKVKSVADSVGSKSLDALTKIASDVIASIIKSTLGLP